MTGLLDTNIALYLLGGKLAVPLPPGSYGVSVITKMAAAAANGLRTEEICSIIRVGFRPADFP